MIEKIVSFCIKHRGLLAIAMCVIIVVGALSYVKLPKQSFPKVSYPSAVVTAVYPGASAEEMEQLVTKELERAVMSVKGYDSSSSTSMPNASAVVVSFDLSLSDDEIQAGIDDLRVKMDDVRAQLPDGVTSLTVNSDLMDTAAIVLAVSGSDISNDELLQRTNELCDSLSQLDGVTKLELWGDNPSKVNIEVDHKKLNHIGLTLTELTSMLSANNYTLPTGSIKVNDSDIELTSSGKYNSVEEISSTMVSAGENGEVVTLRDIADIEVGPDEDAAYYLFEGEKSIVVAVYFSEELNIVSMGDKARAIIDDCQKKLPQGVSINEVYFRPDVVADDINDFVVNVIEAILIVMLIVMFGMNFRNGILVSIAIPLSVFINFIVMPLFKLDIQFISLASLIIVLGMLVDSSIVVSDSIQVLLNAGTDRLTACIEGTKRVAKPVFLSVLSTAVAFSAMLTMTGVYKQVAKSLPLVIITCLAASYLVAMLVAPMLSYVMLKPRDSAKKKDVMLDAYDKVFRWAFKRKKSCIAATIIIALLCGATIPFAKIELIPKAAKSYITIEVTADNSNIKKTEEIVSRVQAIVDDMPEKEYSIAGIGVGMPKFDFSVNPGTESASSGAVCARLSFKNSSRFKNAAQAVKYLQKEIDASIVGAKIHVNELGVVPKPHNPVEAEIYCDDIDTLNAAASETAAYLEGLGGTTFVNYDFTGAGKSYYLDMNVNKLGSLALTKAEVENELSIALMGRTATIFKNNGKEYDVVVKSNLSSSSDLENYEVKSSLGNKCMIKQFANVELTDRYDTIKHINGRRGAIVGCYMEEGTTSMALQGKLTNFLETADFPEGVSFESTGDLKDVVDVTKTISFAFLLALIIVFVILYLQFGKLSHVLLVFMALPVGMVAGVAPLILAGQEISFFAMLGIMSMLGIVLANAITLLDFIGSECKKGTPVEEACLISGKQRFRPILMSTMTTVLGLFPLALSGSPLFKGMAILLMVGLTVSMIVNLILVPIVYSLIERDGNKNE